MNRLLHILPLLLLGAGWTADAGAQTFERIERRNFWNAGRNVAGLRADSVSISGAELYGSAEHGAFRDFSDASESWHAGATARTITHLKRISMAGKFTFDHAAGRNMSGSMFIEPGFYPVDVLEFTPGTKELQTYAFTGGIAADVASRWRIGAGIAFSSQNYAKRKDLRHTNYRLDMTVTPGVMYHAGDGAVGLTYVFRKTGEEIKAEEIGETAAAYYAFLDKGLMYGAYEVWTGNGVHLNEAGIDGFPVREISHGIAMQGAWRGFYADAEYLHGNGKIGEKQTVWFEFPSHSVTVRAGYRFGHGETVQSVRLTVAWMRQTNDENVIGKTVSNGVTTTTIYGSNRIFERDILRLNPEYEWYGPQGEFRGGAEVTAIRRLSSQMYPYLYGQSAFCSRVYMSGMVRIGRFDVRAGAAFFTGSMTETFRTVDGDVAAGDPPCHLTEYYDLQNEYMSAPRVTAEFSVRYNTHWGLYAEAGAGWTHGFDLRYIGGADRWCETLKIGYTF